MRETIRAWDAASKRRFCPSVGLAGNFEICQFAALGQYDCPIFGERAIDVARLAPGAWARGFRHVTIVTSKRDLEPVAAEAIRAHAG